MAANQQAAPKQPKEPKVQVQKQLAQEQPKEQLQAVQNQSQLNQEQPKEQLQATQEQPKEQAQLAQEQPKEQLQAAQEQSNEQLELAQEQPQEQLQAAQEQSNEQLELAQEQPQLTQEQLQAAQQFIEAAKTPKEELIKLVQGDARVKLVLDVIKEIKSKLKAEPNPVRTGIQGFHDNMMAESEQRAAAHLKAKEESNDSNVVTRRK